MTVLLMPQQNFGLKFAGRVWWVSWDLQKVRYKHIERTKIKFNSTCNNNMTICIIMHLKYFSKGKKLAKVSTVSRQCPRHWRILPATISKCPRLSAKRLVETCALKNVPEIAGFQHICQQSNMLNIRCLLPNWIFIIIAIICIYIGGTLTHFFQWTHVQCSYYVHCQLAAKLRQINPKWNNSSLS